MAKAEISIRILSQDEVLFEGSVTTLFVPAKGGEIAVLPYHVPMVVLLSAGSIKVRRQGKALGSVCAVQSGVLHVSDNAATVLVSA